MNDIKELLKQLEQAYTNPACLEPEKAKRYYNAINNLQQRINKLEKYSRGNIEACKNRLNSPFCNLEKTSKELMIHKNYLEILIGDVEDE